MAHRPLVLPQIHFAEELVVHVQAEMKVVAFARAGEVDFQVKEVGPGLERPQGMIVFVEVKFASDGCAFPIVELMPRHSLVFQDG